MEKIPLRAYNREIERLIDNDRSPEALEHCQKILEIYPRCLDTYRLMGKAYLEMHQYDKSEETFKMVLSFVPDDFIANLGMSLLREKQTNLEGTIWHMERAFEAQSSNTAVQNELRRLYKQRDGVDTPRIRLTRGGLVRMYIKGDMLQQALSEIQSILVDDPSRMDIRVVQADALVKAGKKEEGLQVCQQILAELPYCFEANRLLFENKTSDIKIDTVQSVQQHLRELDPYYEFTSPIQPDPISVPEEEVLVEALDGLGLKTATAISDHDQPSSTFNAFKEATEHQFEKTDNGGWQTDLERFGEHSDEQKPSWMDDLQTPTFQAEQINGTSSGNSPATQNTGFNSGKNMTTNDSSSQNEYSTTGGNPQSSGSDDANSTPNPFLAIPGNSLPAAEPGDIPEWLKALASEPPAASSDAITAPLRVPGETGVLQTGEENLEFLRTLQGETATPNQNEQSPEQPEIPSPSESLSGILTPNPFLPSTENTQPVPIEDGESAPVAPSRDMPTWLRSASEPTPEPISEQPVSQPVTEDFRQDFIPETPPTPESFNKSAAIENQYQPPQPEFAEPTQVASAESVPSNLQETLDKVRRETDSKEQPEWLKHENLGSDIAALFEETKAPIEETPEAEGEPDWMAQLREENEAHPEPASSTTPISVPNVPDWLFTQEDTGGATAPIQSDAPVTHQPPPDWLAAARPDIFAQDFQAEEEKPVETPMEPSLSDSLDFSTSREETEIPGMTSAEVPPPAESQPDLSFLDSQPVDFMNADRRPLTDNLVMPEQPFGSRDDMDISGAAPAESLPADLAAMLREEAESEFTTNPLEPDTVPEIPLDKIPGLASSAVMDEFKTEEPQVETPQFYRETVSDSVTIAPEAELSSHPQEVTSSADLISQPEASTPVFEPFNRPVPETIAPTEMFSESEIPEVPEATPSMEIGISASEPLTRPVESLPPMDFFVSPLVEEKPVPAEKPLADIPTIEEIIEAVTPKVKEPELVDPTLFVEPAKPAIETEPEQIVKKPIEGKTIPVSSLPAFEVPVVEEKPTPQKMVEESVVPIFAPQPAVEKPVVPVQVVKEPPAPQPVVEKPVVPIPVVHEPPAPQPIVKEPVVREPVVAKPAAPKPVAEKPVVKTPAPEPRVAKPVRPSAPKPVRYEEKTIPVQPAIQRKNAGSADLVRAREAFAKGDVNTALRRYIKLINSNKALDSVSSDLKDLVRKHPKDYLAWQTYGDARLRSNRIQEALDAYAKAADLLK